MKIIETDNYDRRDKPERLIVAGVTDFMKAQAICNALNAAFPEDHDRYYKTVEDEYVLDPGFQP